MGHGYCRHARAGEMFIAEREASMNSKLVGPKYCLLSCFRWERGGFSGSSTSLMLAVTVQ
jgi:hypothetical protein